MGIRSPLVATAAMATAAVSGAALAIGGTAFFFGIGRGSTTIVRETLPAPASPASVGLRSGASINEIYRAAAPGVVQVSTTTTVTRPVDPFGSFFGFPAQQAQETAHALGSGFVVDKAGHIVTNYHVVEGATSVSV